MLLRGLPTHHDAGATGGRSGGAQGYLPPSTSTRSSRRMAHHDLFHGDAFVNRMMNFWCRCNSASATWRFRLELDSPGLTASGILLDQHLARGRRILESWLGCLPAAERAAILAGVGVDYYLWSLQSPASAR